MENINNSFASFSISSALKEKRFNTRCLSYYENDRVYHLTNYFIGNNDIHRDFILRPFYQQVVDWFRETHNIDININRCYGNSNKYSFLVERDMKTIFKGSCVSYYDGLEKTIEEAIKFI